MTGYTTAVPFFSTLPTWISNDDDKNRLAAYNFYDDLFDNSPDEYRLMLRGDQDDMPIYVPTAKQVVKTLSRYVARGLGFTVETAGDPTAAVIAFGELFKRERFFSRFSAAKRWGLVRGDMCWQLMADPLKLPGTRISLRPLDPRNYFPIIDYDDPDRVLGCDIAFQTSVDNKPAVRRERYLKPSHPDHPQAGTFGAPVSYQVDILEMSNWQDESKLKIMSTEVPQMLLPPEITALPVYHIKIDEEPENPYGRSVLQGMERIFLGVNQAVSDEDISLAMAGLGFYATDNQTEEGEDWVIGPKRVVELSTGGKFERVSGVASVEPAQSHIKYLKSEVFNTLGINDVALGNVDTTIAESGIALKIRMGPLLDESDEIDNTIRDVLTQMFHDMIGWLAAYEQVHLADDVVVLPSFSEKIPPNQQEYLTNLRQAMIDRVISVDFYRSELAKAYGLEFPATMQQDINRELQEMAAMADPFNDRINQELNNQ